MTEIIKVYCIGFLIFLYLFGTSAAEMSDEGYDFRSTWGPTFVFATFWPIVFLVIVGSAIFTAILNMHQRFIKKE